MGVSLKGDAPRPRSLKENAQDVSKESAFKLNGDHFGIRNRNTRRAYAIECDDPIKEAQKFYDKIGYGGRFMETGNENRVQLSDGTIINYRVKSKSGGPVVDINVQYSNEAYGIKTHKLHFIKRR